MLRPLSLFIFLLSVGSLSSCLKDDCVNTRLYQVWYPVYANIDEYRTDIQMEPARALESPGKIYVYGNLLLINEFREGVHMIDNSDPAAPHPIGFLPIPGNVDMAVKDNYLYADNYLDQVVIDLSNPTAPTFVNRVFDVFPSLSFHEEFGHLMYYEPTDEMVKGACDEARDFFWLERSVLAFDANNLLSANSISNNSAAGVSAFASVTGVGGSMARFTINGDYLYTVSEHELQAYSLTQPEQPSLDNTVELGLGIETIFPYDNHLFIGSESGMHIYSLSDPAAPTQLSIFQHARACDPVFVRENLAFVTLRDGNTCQGFTNQLDVVDVSTLTNPVMVKSYPMQNPHGLSVTDDFLFLCEGAFGLKTFAAADHADIAEGPIVHLTSQHAFDIIVLDSKQQAILTGEDGIYQYRYDENGALSLLSVLPVEAP